MTWLYNFIGDILSAFSTLFGGKYVFALLLYALIFKVLFLPFGIKQQKSQIKMARLAPKIELIKAKYKGRTDQITMRKQQEEIMELQQKEGYSPFSGCLPLLIQFPLIIFLYNVIRSPLSYICKLSDDVVVALSQAVGYSTAEFSKIEQIGLISKLHEIGGEISYVAGDAAGVFDTATLPNFNLFGLNLASTPSFKAISWLVVIPFIAAGIQYLSMVLMRKWNSTTPVAAGGADAQAQASMKMMDIMMPLMTVFFAFNFSAMLGLYWIYQSLLGILQTFIIAKAMPLPKFTEEELKAMRKAQREAEKAQKAALKTQPKYKSLHYIDEDDYDELPTIKGSEKKTTKLGGADAPEIKD
jgi:YidC/Oxa1 family membrane protein insertase